jgi:hypothetical protein
MNDIDNRHDKHAYTIVLAGLTKWLKLFWQSDVKFVILVGLSFGRFFIFAFLELGSWIT